MDSHTPVNDFPIASKNSKNPSTFFHIFPTSSHILLKFNDSNDFIKSSYGSGSKSNCLKPFIISNIE